MCVVYIQNFQEKERKIRKIKIFVYLLFKRVYKLYKKNKVSGIVPNLKKTPNTLLRNNQIVH